MKTCHLLLALLCLPFLTLAAPAPVPALIIVNWAYQFSDPLLTPEQDAVIMESALRQQGFTVQVAQNLTTADLRKTIATFVDQHKSRPVALIYFSGHGTSLDSQNYLLGTDTNLDLTERWGQLAAAFGGTSSTAFQKAEADLLREHAERTMFPVREMLGFADESAGPRQVKMIFLDCCRDVLAIDKKALNAGKFAIGAKSTGMAPMDSVRETPGIYFGFAAASGQVANQNTDMELKDNLAIPLGGSFHDLLRPQHPLRRKPSELVKSLPPSLFTQNLAIAIQQGGSLDEVFRNTGLAVYETTQKLRADNPTTLLQSPAQYGIVYGKFEFQGSHPPSSPVSMARPADSAELERLRLENEALKRSAAAMQPPSAISDLPSSASSPFTNSLGMKFVPVPGTQVQFCVHETRVADFAAFVADSGSYDYSSGDEPYTLDSDGYKQRSGYSWKKPGFPQTDDHPVTCVSWEDAQAFCKWLSKKEGKTYRLPTDHEWSVAVGIGSREDASASPGSKDAKTEAVYPWGGDFPPGSGAGNYAGSEAKTSTWPSNSSTIEGYRDDFARTAPVMNFSANKLGIYDLGGNVWEWCGDRYYATQEYRVLRGGSWVTGDSSYLLSSCRGVGPPANRYDGLGFRLVLVSGG